MVKLWFENDNSQPHGKENYNEIRQEDPATLINKMLIVGQGNPSIVIRAIVDLSVDDEFLRAHELLITLERFTKKDDPSVIKAGGHKHVFDNFVTLLFIEYAHLLAEINRIQSGDEGLVLSQTRKFSRAYGLPYQHAMSDEFVHKEVLARFDFQGKHPTELFEAIFVNHLLDPAKIN